MFTLAMEKESTNLCTKVSERTKFLEKNKNKSNIKDTRKRRATMRTEEKCAASVSL